MIIRGPTATAISYKGASDAFKELNDRRLGRFRVGRDERTIEFKLDIHINNSTLGLSVNYDNGAGACVFPSSVNVTVMIDFEQRPPSRRPF